MLHDLQDNGCAMFDISGRTPKPDFKFDFDSLVPATEGLTEEDVQAISEVESTLQERQGDDAMPINIFNSLLKYFLDQKDFRSAFWIVMQANTGLRYSDVSRFRRIDLLNEHNQFRESILNSEQKTGKKRVNFINDAIKMITLIYLWNTPEIKPLDLMMVADPNSTNKGYEKETYINAKGKKRCLKINGEFVYKRDENGRKIPTPLSLSRASTIMRDALVNGLGVSIRNDGRTKNNANAYLKLASHSLRKTYVDAVINQFVRDFDANTAYAHTAAIEFLQYDLNHSSRKMSYHYVGDFIATKKKTNLALNVGIEILLPYFEAEREKFIHAQNTL